MKHILTFLLWAGFVRLVQKCWNWMVDSSTLHIDNYWVFFVWFTIAFVVWIFIGSLED